MHARSGGMWAALGVMGLGLGCATPAWQLSERSAINQRQKEAQRRYPEGTPPCTDLKTCWEECTNDRWASCGRLSVYYRDGDGVLTDPVEADRLALTPCLTSAWGTAEERTMCCAHAVAVRTAERIPPRTDTYGYERYRFLHRNGACAIACSKAFPVACTEEALQRMETDPQQADDLKVAAAALYAGCTWGHAAACALLAELPPDLLKTFQAELAKQAIRTARSAAAADDASAAGGCTSDDDCAPGVACAEAARVGQPRQCEAAVRCGSGAYCQGDLVCEPHPGLVGADGFCQKPRTPTEAFSPVDLRLSDKPRCFLVGENRKVCY